MRVLTNLTKLNDADNASFVLNDALLAFYVLNVMHCYGRKSKVVIIIIVFGLQNYKIGGDNNIKTRTNNIQNYQQE